MKNRSLIPRLSLVSAFLSAVLLWSTAAVFAQDSTASAIVHAGANSTGDSLSFERPPVWLSDARETDELIAEDLQDFMLAQPAVQALDFGTLGQISPLVIHGASPSESAVLLNDLPFDDPIVGMMNPFQVPVNLIGSETYLGPGDFAPFGFQALGGTLQASTFPYEPNHAYSKVFFRAGDWGYSDLGAIFIVPVNPEVQISIGGNRQEFEGFISGGGQDHTGTRMYAKVAFRPRENVTLSYLFHRNRDKNGVPAPFAPEFVPLPTNPKREELRFEHRLSLESGDLQKSRHRFLLRLTVSSLRQKAFSGSSRLFNHRDLAYGAALQQDFVFGHHRFAVGGNLRIFDLTSDKLGDHTDAFGYVFLRDDLRLAPAWRFAVQARVEKQRDFAAAVTPSVKLSYRPGENLEFYWGGQRAKRYPSFSERFWPDSTYFGRETLQEETGLNSQAGLRLTDGGSLLHVAVFQNHVSDWIAPGRNFASSQVNELSNAGSRNIYGVDVKLRWEYGRGGQMGLTGSYLHVQENDLKKKLQVPEWTAYAYLEYGHSFFDKYVFIKARIDGRFFGRRYGLSYRNDSRFGSFVRLDPDVVVDGKLSLIFKDAKLVISQENMFDRQYELVPGFLMPVRTLRFGVEWEFWD